MKRSASFLFLLALVTLFAFGCGSSSSSDTLAPDYSGFYSIREPDPGTGPTRLLRYTSAGVTTVATVDFSSLTTPALPDFVLISAGSAFDTTSMSIYGIGSITDSVNGKSLVFKVDVKTGAVSGFAGSDAVRFTNVIISGSNAYLFSNDPATGAEALIAHPLAGGAPSASTTLALDALYPGYTVDIVPAAVVLDGSSGKVFLLLRRTLAGPEEFSIVRADLATGALETPIELGETYHLGNLFLKGTELLLTGEDSSGSSKIVKVPTAGGAISVVSTLDFTPVFDTTHTEAQVARYTKAVDQGGDVLLVPLSLLSNIGGDDVNVLVAVNVGTGAMVKLDTVTGCYFLNSYVP